jgi:hypothetical protein
MARKMMKSGIEFREEREVALLARRKRCGLFGDGRNKGLVICEECERMTLKEETEMFGCEESSQQFLVKSGVTSLWWGKFFGEERKRLPGAIDFLLKNSSNVGVGGISG